MARLSRETDTVVIGRRIRAARLAAGLTQEELVAGAASAAYLSRIERGDRRASLRLLYAVAERTGTSVGSLVACETTASPVDVDLRLDYAELTLKNGDAKVALTSVQEALEAAVPDPTGALALRARFLRASAREVLGDYPGAVQDLAWLTAELPVDLHWIGVAMSLTRCYRIQGEFDRALACGTSAGSRAEDAGLSDTEEAIRLAVTVAGVHLERGDLQHALRLCERAAERAERIDSDLARGSAYWNASVAQGYLGDLPSAVALAERALAAFETSADARSRGMLQGALAELQLRLEPPRLDAAEANLRAAREVSEWSDASMVSRERLRLVSVRLLVARGRLDDARREARASLAATGPVALMLAAEANILLGRMALLDGDHREAIPHFRAAALTLTACGADRPVAECWFELGGALQAMGDDPGALDAFRRAAVSNGLAIGSGLSAPR